MTYAGYMVGSRYERGGIAKDGAKMVRAVSTTTVPKLSVVLGSSFGAGNYGMCGRAYGGRFLWMWPNAKVGVMGSGQLESVMRSVSKWVSSSCSQSLCGEVDVHGEIETRNSTRHLRHVSRRRVRRSTPVHGCGMTVSFGRKTRGMC
jgi:acetyl-CoA carboxylase carboxyltransferase component